MITTRDRIALFLTSTLLIAVGVGMFLFATGCTHPAPPLTPNHAIEYVTILDHGARCEDWRDHAEIGATHSALCMSGPELFWCVAPRDAKPHCDLLYSPPKPAQAGTETTKATPTTTDKPKEP